MFDYFVTLFLLFFIVTCFFTKFKILCFSSSPQEEELHVHIRAIGPWTTAIRQLFKDVKNHVIPRIEVHNKIS